MESPTSLLRSLARMRMHRTRNTLGRLCLLFSLVALSSCTSSGTALPRADTDDVGTLKVVPVESASSVPFESAKGGEIESSADRPPNNVVVKGSGAFFDTSSISRREGKSVV